MTNNGWGGLRKRAGRPEELAEDRREIAEKYFRLIAKARENNYHGKVVDDVLKQLASEYRTTPRQIETCRKLYPRARFQEWA